MSRALGCFSSLTTMSLSDQSSSLCDLVLLGLLFVMVNNGQADG
jgi:hypothetical protein